MILNFIGVVLFLFLAVDFLAGFPTLERLIKKWKEFRKSGDKRNG